MRLTVSTPTSVIEDVDGVRHVRAEDETGAFGILPGHTNLVAVLPISIVTWRAHDDREGFVLVRQGVMT
ncbi:MAG: F0F1 ATP synthase subunit epsilon, partial [Planctomycetes bacterium]|nr:F0F1 ATP synthase subunit epsilon [Planctomycetota bacterium]